MLCGIERESARPGVSPGRVTATSPGPPPTTTTPPKPGKYARPRRQCGPTTEEHRADMTASQSVSVQDRAWSAGKLPRHLLAPGPPRVQPFRVRWGTGGQPLFCPRPCPPSPDRGGGWLTRRDRERSARHHRSLAGHHRVRVHRGRQGPLALQRAASCPGCLDAPAAGAQCQPYRQQRCRQFTAFEGGQADSHDHGVDHGHGRGWRVRNARS